MQTSTGEWWAIEHAGVELAHQRQLPALELWPRLRGLDVGNGLAAGLENRALEAGREKAAVEVVEAPRRNQPAIEHDEARQVIARAANAVSDPRSHAGTPELPRAGVHKQLRRRVIEQLRPARVHQ